MPDVHSLSTFVIGGRTNDSGSAQSPDVDQWELRMPHPGNRTPGRLWNLLDQSPNPDAFKVRQGSGSDMNVKVGSNIGAHRDGYVLRGTLARQGNYTIAIGAATITVAVPAADASLLTAYGVYVYVNDAAYSGTASRAYAQLACLAGTPHASAPVVPSALAAWSAYELLWSFRLAALATAVTNTILDNSNAVDARKTSSSLGVSALDLAPFL